MRFAPFILVLLLVAGCAHDDARLQGTWHSNRDATVAAAFERDQRWTNAPPDKVARFKDLFGYMTVTYSNGVATSEYRGEVGLFRYKVIESGTNYVIVDFDTPIKQRETRITFVKGDASYWLDTGPLGSGLQERFDRVQNK
jgi:hypothetical protein